MLSAGDKNARTAPGDHHELTGPIDIDNMLGDAEGFLSEPAASATPAANAKSNGGGMLSVLGIESPLGLFGKLTPAKHMSPFAFGRFPVFTASANDEGGGNRRDSLNLFDDLGDDDKNVESLDNVKLDLCEQSPEKPSQNAWSPQLRKIASTRSIRSSVHVKSPRSQLHHVTTTAQSSPSTDPFAPAVTPNQNGKRSIQASPVAAHTPATPPSAFRGWFSTARADDQDSLPRSPGAVPVPAAQTDLPAIQPFAMSALQQALPSSTVHVGSAAEDHLDPDDSTSSSSSQDETAFFNKTITQDMIASTGNLRFVPKHRQSTAEPAVHSRLNSMQSVSQEEEMEDADQTILAGLRQSKPDDDWDDLGMGFFHQPDVGPAVKSPSSGGAVQQYVDAAPLRLEDLNATGPASSGPVPVDTPRAQVTGRRSMPAGRVAEAPSSEAPPKSKLSLSERLDRIKQAHAASRQASPTAPSTTKATTSPQSKTETPVPSRLQTPASSKVGSPIAAEKSPTVVSNSIASKRRSMSSLNAVPSLKRTIDVRSPMTSTQKPSRAAPSALATAGTASANTSPVSAPIFAIPAEPAGRRPSGNGEPAKRIKLTGGPAPAPTPASAPTVKSLPMPVNRARPTVQSSSGIPSRSGIRPPAKNYNTLPRSVTPPSSSLLSQSTSSSSSSTFATASTTVAPQRLSTLVTKSCSALGAKAQSSSGLPRPATSALPVPTTSRGASGLPMPTAHSASSLGRARPGVVSKLRQPLPKP